MRGVVPEFDPPEVGLREDASRKRLVLGYRLLTPLFGGGPQPGRCDPLTAVRTATIAGQLRFWWRACRAAAYPDLGALKAAEDSLWGSTTVRSQVMLEVRRTQAGQARKPFTLQPGKNFPAAHADVAPAYAAFPLQPNSKNPEEKTLQCGVEFELVVTYPAASEADIRAALWAWSTFGGVGARTRKGFGALAQISENGQAITHPSSRDLVGRLREELKHHLVVTGKPIPGVPRLEPAMILVPTKVAPGPGTAHKAWSKLIECYRGFRQARRPGTPPKPGRSYWPEPDAIRRQTGQADPNHRTPVCKVDRYPRGAFGLPIIFHFKDRGDPGDCTLQGPNHDRRASPLILRPLLCSDGSVGLAAVLKPWGGPPGGYVLSSGRSDVAVRADLDGVAVADLQPVKPLNKPPKVYNNVFEPFLELVKEVQP